MINRPNLVKRRFDPWLRQCWGTPYIKGKSAIWLPPGIMIPLFRKAFWLSPSGIPRPWPCDP